MIRWRFIFIRLLIVAAIVISIQLGASPVADYLTIQTVQTITGAKAEIGRTQVELFPPRIVYTDFRVADPRGDKGMQDVFRADHIDLLIDGDSLLRRRYIVSDARVTGIEVGASRQTNGHLPSEPEQQPEADAGPSLLGRLFGSVTESAEQQAEALLAEMRTKQVADEIRVAWEQEYRQLAQRARDLEQQIRGIRDRTRDISNPLRDLPEIQRTIADANAAREELLSVRNRMESLPEKLRLDFARLDEAKRHDIEKLKEVVPVDLSQGADVAVDLLVASVRQQITRVKGYLESGRTIADYTVVAPKSERSRGEDYDMEGSNRRPSVLIRNCEVAGILRANGKVYSLAGVLENLTPTPQILDEPARAKVRLEGPEIVRLEYVRDQRGGADVDLLTLHFPEMGERPIRLGNSRNLGIAVSGGQRELWVKIRNENDVMQGRLISKQSRVNLDLTVDPKFENSVAAQSLRSSLANVDNIEIDAHFDGSWDDMNVHLNTNLSRIFKQATHDAVVHQTAATQQKLTAKVATIHQEQTEKLQNWLGTQQSEAVSLLASADKSIEEMKQKVISQMGDADVYLGKLRGSIGSKLLR